MYKELNKYKTGKTVKGKGVVVNANNREIDISLDRYSAPLGDLIKDYIDHRKKPWWKRKYNHNHLNEIYVNWLNKVKIEHTF